MPLKLRILFFVVSALSGGSVVYSAVSDAKIYTVGQAVLVCIIAFMFFLFSIVGDPEDVLEQDSEKELRERVARARKFEQDQRRWEKMMRDGERRRERERMDDEEKVKESLGKWADRW